MLTREQLTTRATMTTHSAQIATPGHCRLNFELLVDLVFDLTSLIGHGMHLRGFRGATGIQAILLGSEQDLFQIAHIGLQLAKMLVAHNRLVWRAGREPTILLVARIGNGDCQVVRRRTPTYAPEHPDER